MKRLTLARHAKSSWEEEGMSDFDRPLNKRGKHDAPEMGKRLAKRGEKPDLILSSPAIRAISTARTVAEKIGYPVEKIQEEMAIYLADAGALLSFVRQIDDSASDVYIFGHNPTFTDLAQALTRQQVDNIPTCGVFQMQFECTRWRDVAEGEGEAVYFDYPKRDEKDGD